MPFPKVMDGEVLTLETQVDYFLNLQSKFVCDCGSNVQNPLTQYVFKHVQTTNKSCIIAGMLDNILQYPFCVVCDDCQSCR